MMFVDGKLAIFQKYFSELKTRGNMATELGKDKIFWTKSMNLKLVKFIKAKPFIWNSKHPRYTSTDLRERTYAKFARRYGNEFSGDIVKQRWTNIRTAFSHYLRKKKAALDSEKEFTVKWHLWEACQFLRKANKPLHNADKDDVFISSIQTNPLSDESDSIPTIINTSNSGKQIDCEEFSQQLVNVFKNFQNDAFGLENTRNSAVGKAVSRKLSKMNSFEAATMCQKISQILLLYDNLNPNNPNLELKSDMDLSDFD